MKNKKAMYKHDFYDLNKNLAELAIESYVWFHELAGDKVEIVEKEYHPFADSYMIRIHYNILWGAVE